MIRQLLIASILLHSAIDLLAQNCQLNPPAGLYVSDITSCSATLHWKTTTTVKKYSVSYKLSGSSEWSSAINVGKDTLFNFTGLLSGKKYDFAVKAKCSDGSVSPQVQKSAKTLACSLPDQVSITPVNSSSVKIKVKTPCPYNNLHVRYSTLSGVPVIKSFPFANNYEILELNPDSVYLFEVSTCKLQLNTWTAVDTIYLVQRPNIILILVDDSRYDYYSCNGAFPFIQTPNIDRIANEGVNFNRAYVATSLCAPSRASIATGLFTLKTGVVDNGVTLDTSFVTIPEVLHNEGYYTALVGKNHGTFLEGNKPEFDYYLVAAMSDEGGAAQNYFNYNGTFKTIPGPNVLTTTDSAISLITKTDKPLFLWLAYMQPHHPDLPLPENIGKYDDEVIPWRPDTARFEVNYPSTIYMEKMIHGYDLDTTFRDVMEVVAGLDSCIGEVLDALEKSDKLDNTLIIFTSDNGNMMGSHWLNGKTLAYEPSMRTAMLLRYPEWFSAGSIVKNRFATNLDIAPTIYEAAGIEYNEPLDGRSLKDLYSGQFNRNAVYYLMYHNVASKFPSKRAVRDKYYKYIHYSCTSDTVEELFDMINDSLELTNLVNNHLYENTLNFYRHKFDSLRIVWNDTSDGPLKNCFIKEPFVLKEWMEENEMDAGEPYLFPTITSNSVQLYIPWDSCTVHLYNEFGEMVATWEIHEPFSQLVFPGLHDGLYFIHLTGSFGQVTRKLIISSQGQ